MDSALTSLLNQGTAWVAAGVNGRRRGNRHPSIVPYETYETADRADRRSPPATSASSCGCARRSGWRRCRRRALRDQRGARGARRRARRGVRGRAARAARRRTGSRCCARRRSRPARSTSVDEAFALAEELGMEPVEEVDGAAADPPAAARRRRAPADPPRARPRWTSTATSCARGSARLHVGDQLAAVQQRVNQQRRRLVASAISAVAKSSSDAMFVDAQVTTPQPPSVFADARCTWPATTRRTCGCARSSSASAARSPPAARSRPATAAPSGSAGGAWRRSSASSGSPAALASHSRSSVAVVAAADRRVAHHDPDGPRLAPTYCMPLAEQVVVARSAVDGHRQRRQQLRRPLVLARVAGVRDVAGHQHGHRRWPQRQHPLHRRAPAPAASASSSSRMCGSLSCAMRVGGTRAER